MSDLTPRPLVEIIAGGPLPYDQFLDAAAQIAVQLQELHRSGYCHGHLSAHTITMDHEGRLTVPPPPQPLPLTQERVSEDLYEAGLVFSQMLAVAQEPATEQPIHPILSEDLPLDAATYLMPVEARLLLEELLAKDARQRMRSADELVSTLEELKQLQKMPLEPSASGGRDNTRLYFYIAMAALVLLALWMSLGFLLK